MARPLRIELSGALHHVTARGNERRSIFFSDDDRSRFLDLLQLARSIVLNPVRARMVSAAGEWPWSSYRATVGLAHRPEFLTTDPETGYDPGTG